ncbi:complex I intermediate-associated protein-like protein 84 [Paraphaeosphaeria sporulosa]|uniref:Complex I intermediate-associated protein-like protein 84 n=1 Tax=Paraphaeosphaeria sporulosa TaxID=1460663 RepID=A0A177CX20_9PLEO|nr:complex I intermediate-associated protein-like protein 84 [Paraphaeosphaeria sporulosa]OAG11452.1 complex I intermediate-associated protein-like protein 84 [Paraphaeosphaeria sporulosa]
MPSHLTRVVFRSIIADTPLICRGCVQRTPRLRASFQHGPRAIAPQRRTFLGMFKPERKIKPPDVPAGLEVMGELIQAQGDGLRPPTPAQVAAALDAFFTQKKADVEDFHVAKALNALQYLLANPKEDGQPWLSYKSMNAMMYKIERYPPGTGGTPHRILAKLLDAEIEKVIGNEMDLSKSLATLTVYEAIELPKLVRILCTYGASLEARDLANKTFGTPSDKRSLHEDKIVRNTWKAVVAGFAKEGNTPELIKTTEMMRDAAATFTSEVQGVLVKYFVERNDLEQAKHWYSTAIPEWDDGRGLQSALGPFLTSLALSGDTAFGQQVVASLLQEMPAKETWDAIFVWSAAIGKGADEIDRMMNVMIRRNQEERQKSPEKPVILPDIKTINSLVELAMSKQDSYSAERFVVLGEKRGIYPDEKTYTMQMRYRLSINDIDGARAAYYGLQGQITEDSDCAEAVNKLIQALCNLQQHHFDDIMAIVDDLHERNVRLTPETVATVCVLHLRRGEPHDAGDLLNMHAHHLSPEQRVVIRNGLASFIMDSQTSTAEAWETYQMLRHAFPETPRADRIPLMDEFFRRKRSDMACHVFFHMRNSVEETIAADKEVYVKAFVGFARNADAESLELVSNQLKIDLNVEMDTQLRNSLMLAWAATKNNGRALSMWGEIGSSREGPTYNSIAIAFRACEGTHHGERHARSIWARLKELDVDIDKQIFTAYMCAIARNHRHDDALALIEAAEEEYGFTPDFYILGNWFQCTANIDRQEKVEEWIKARYPAVWKQLEALGSYRTMDGFGYRQFNFNRDLEP